MPANIHEQCPCGLPKEKGHVLCTECWRAAPASDRAAISHRDGIIKARAIHRLLDFARQRSRKQPNLL